MIEISKVIVLPDVVWIPCVIQQPKNEGEYLIMCRNRVVKICYWDNFKWGYFHKEFTGNVILWSLKPEANSTYDQYFN